MAGAAAPRVPVASYAPCRRATVTGRARSASPVAIWSAFLVAIACAVGRVVLAIIDLEKGSAGDPFARDAPRAAFDALTITLFATVGLVVARKRPTNPVGWILCVIPPTLGVLLVSNRLYESLAADESGGPAAELVAWITSWIWIPFVFSALILFPLLFPTGKVLTPRWRLVLVAVAVAFPLLFMGTAFAPGRLREYPFDNPFGAPSVFRTPVLIFGSVGFALLVVCMFAAAASLILRFHRSRGEERLQLKWVTTAAAVLVLTFALPTELWVGEQGAFVVILLGLSLVEVAVGIAMLRYRLYDIDLVINRALVYGPLTATLAVVYAGTVLLLQVTMSGVTEGSELAVAASTLAVAALFRPVRTRIQRVVDRRFFRSRYDAALIVGAFGARLRDEVALSTLSTDLLHAVHTTVQPSHATLWLRSETHRDKAHGSVHRHERMLQGH